MMNEVPSLGNAGARCATIGQFQGIRPGMEDDVAILLRGLIAFSEAVEERGELQGEPYELLERQVLWYQQNIGELSQYAREALTNKQMENLDDDKE